MTMQLRCTTCGKTVSTPVPEDTVVRAVLACPECVGEFDYADMLARYADTVGALEGVDYLDAAFSGEELAEAYRLLRNRRRRGPS